MCSKNVPGSDNAVKRSALVNLSFKNKVALVTGAASGMGLATARAFAEAGAAVALADVHEDAVRSAAEELVSAGYEAIAVRCNVADEAEVAAMVEQTVSTFGRLDAAFNNAGTQSPAVETADARGEEFDRVNGINLRGVWNCMKYGLRQMREQRSGASSTILPLAVCTAPSRQQLRRKAFLAKWSAVDWSKQNTELGAEMGLSRDRIRQIRQLVGAPKSP